MGFVIGLGGQKGGAGKTTAATGLAVAAAKNGLTVLIGDMDTTQQSALDWGQRRAETKLEPPIEVRTMTPEAIAKARELVDLLVLDLPGRADKLTHDVARQADLLVVVTDTNKLELNPTIDLLRALRDVGMESPRVVVAMTKVRDEHREADAREYLTAAGFPPLKDALPDYNSIHDVGNNGKATSEIAYPDVAFVAKRFFNGIMKALERAVSQGREVAQPAKERTREARGRS